MGMDLGIGPSITGGLGFRDGLDAGWKMYYDFTRAGGIANTVLRGPVPNFTRASEKRYFDKNLIEQVASANEFPLEFDYVTGGNIGRSFYISRNDNSKHNRDLTQAEWVSGGGGMSVAKDAIGLDNEANSCSTLTAVGTNATLLQTITLASDVAAFQPWVQRKTGTGQVDITVDGGTNWVDITADINALKFAPVMDWRTLANPSFGFRIGTTGDEIIVDYAGCHDNAKRGPNILTTATTGALAGDDCETENLSWFDASKGVWFIKFRVPRGTTGGFSNDSMLAACQTGVSRPRHMLYFDEALVNFKFEIDNNGVDGIQTQVKVGAEGDITAAAMRWAENDLALSYEGLTAVTDSSVDIETGHDNFRVGQRSSTHYADTHILKIGYRDATESNTYIEELAAAA